LSEWFLFSLLVQVLLPKLIQTYKEDFPADRRELLIWMVQFLNSNQKLMATAYLGEFSFFKKGGRCSCLNKQTNLLQREISK
jgi:hypothetical protein